MDAEQSKSFAFTKARIDKLPSPDKGRSEYRDTEQPGLVLRVTSTGAKTFSAFVWVTKERKRERITIGKFPTVNVDTARRRTAELMGKVATGENPAEQKRRYLQQTTLGEAFTAYVKNRRASKKRAVDAMEQQFNRWLGKVPDVPKAKHAPHPRRKPQAAVDWTDRRINTITSNDVRDLHRAIVNTGKPTSANRVQEILRAVFNFCGIFPNPAASNAHGNVQGVERAKLKPRRRYMSRDELPLFHKAIDALEPDWRDLFTLLLYVGFRRAAVAAMRWSDVDLENGTWTVPEETSKSGDPIVLPIAGPALEVLKRRHEARTGRNPWVFPADSESGHVENPKKAWERVRTAMETPDLRMHDLRRTLGSWMAAANASELVIAKALGHKDVRSAKVYAWVEHEAARAAQATAHEALLQAATAKK